MSQDNHPLTISQQLSKPQFVKGFKQAIINKRIAQLMRGVNSVRSKDGVKNKTRGILERYPSLFTDLMMGGFSKNQIIEHYSNKK